MVSGRGFQNVGALLQHDNARQQATRSSVASTVDMKFEYIKHQSYPTVTTQREFHVFGGLKMYRSVEEM